MRRVVGTNSQDASEIAYFPYIFNGLKVIIQKKYLLKEYAILDAVTVTYEDNSHRIMDKGSSAMVVRM